MSDAQLAAAVAAKREEATGLLRANKFDQALQVALQGTEDVVLTKDAGVKQANADLVLEVITAAEERKADVGEIIKSLTQSQGDALMKYIYRGLKVPGKSSFLLKWHAKVVEKWNLGPIVRTIVERKTV